MKETKYKKKVSNLTNNANNEALTTCTQMHECPHTSHIPNPGRYIYMYRYFHRLPSPCYSAASWKIFKSVSVEMNIRVEF